MQSLKDVKIKINLRTHNYLIREEKEKLIDAALQGLKTVSDKSDAFKVTFATDLMESANKDSGCPVDCFELAISMYLEGIL